MDKDYFKSIKILDGGMGQLLLEKGVISMGTLWSASALLEKKYHQILVDAHLSYINACLLYTSPSPRDSVGSRMPSSA